MAITRTSNKRSGDAAIAARSWLQQLMNGLIACVPLMALFLVAAVMSSCGITRTETDYYTITNRDSTYTETVLNAPGTQDDNGAVYPSNRTMIVRHNSLSHDSTYDRKYPNFLRLGGIEFAGLMGTSNSTGLGTGLLGLYSLFVPDTNGGSLFIPADSGRHPTTNNTFKGLLLRLLPYEFRLRWFDDAANWTLGSSVMEMLVKDEKSGNRLTSIGANIYLRKRFFLRDRIPYVIATPYVGLSMFPSAYANLGGELQFGSFGGFNLRAYLGYASGFTWNLSGDGKPPTAVSMPYFGFGVSALDFTNRSEETEREWKEYVHSAIEVKAIDIQFIDALASYPNLLDTTLLKLPITGIGLQIGTAHFPLPSLNEHFWAGTTLINWTAYGFYQHCFSILPIRLGYRQYLIAEDMSLEPFVEYNYYPSQVLNLGARLRLDTFSGFTFSLMGGFATGSSGDFLPTVVYTNGSEKIGSISTAYLGLSIGIGDRLLRPEAVHGLRDLEH